MIEKKRGTEREKGGERGKEQKGKKKGQGKKNENRFYKRKKTNIFILFIYYFLKETK